MCCKNKSKIHKIRRLEFLGDGFLNYHMKKLMCHRYPDTMIHTLGSHFSKLVSNRLLDQYAKIHGFSNGNRIEIHLGMLCEQNNLHDAELMVEEIFNFFVKQRKLDTVCVRDMAHVKPHIYNFKKITEINGFEFKPLDFVTI
jgi:hypothetical protein